MERFAILVGATQGIPASKFLGQLPRGLNGSVSGELDNYYDDIKTMQTLELQPALQILDECLIRSALGSRPDDISYLWAPLAQPSSKEIAETGEKLANTIKTLVDTGLYEAGELREAATNQFVNFDVLPNLGDATLSSDGELDDNFGLDGDESVV
jgi:phage-related protein (TIGR01555 family)